MPSGHLHCAAPKTLVLEVALASHSASRPQEKPDTFPQTRLFPLERHKYPSWAQCSLVSGQLPALSPLIRALLSSFRSLAIGPQYSSLATQPILCASIPGLVPKQLRFCRNYVEIMPSVAEGVKISIQECQHQFRGRRWNCTTVNGSLAIFGPVLDKGTQASKGTVT